MNAKENERREEKTWEKKEDLEKTEKPEYQQKRRRTKKNVEEKKSDTSNVTGENHGIFFLPERLRIAGRNLKWDGGAEDTTRRGPRKKEVMRRRRESRRRWKHRLRKMNTMTIMQNNDLIPAEEVPNSLHYMLARQNWKQTQNSQKEHNMT